MNENSFEARYDITKKSRLRKFYESNRILIFSSILILIIILGSFSFYLENREKKIILLSDKYIQAKIYIENDNKDEAIKILKEIIYADNSTYSTLAFFMLLNQNFIKDHKQLLIMFDHLLENACGLLAASQLDGMVQTQDDRLHYQVDFQESGAY